MNGAPYNYHLTQRVNRFMKWPLLCGLLSLVLARAAQATDALWPPADQLNQVFNYTVPGNPPPTIDATAFDIENQFTINFTAATLNPEFFEPWNTVNYTNNGLMVANAPLATNGIFLTFSPGCGFEFDTQTTNANSPQMAGSFYNPGAIRCNSVIDNVNDFFLLGTVGKVIVSATNVVNPGSVTVGANGLMQFTGQSVDLTRSQLTMENPDALLNALTNLFTDVIFELPLSLNVVAAEVGHETNFIDPAVQFSLPDPTSDNFLPPLFLGLQNATAYVNDTLINPSNILVRAVFISNPIPNVTNHVYFNSGFDGFFDEGFGGILVGWDGNYLDPATGQQNTDHMYLEDDFGEITNLQVVAGGGPVNYSWLAQWPFALGPAWPPGLPAGTFDDNFITNDFAYESVQLIPTTVPTNANISNPSGALTNLSGRIQITASQELDLNLARILGPNYMSLTSTNHYGGSIGAEIFSPYSDISLGVTNGFLSISNLLEPLVPVWNGPIQVFSARWTNVDATGVTNTFHVLLVNSQVLPTTPSVVQNLTLHGTNTVISDALTIIGNLSIDATSLTLTTNASAAGVGSLEGELNWETPGTFGVTSQFPNLLWLTNNGAIRAVNSSQFIGNSNIVTVIPVVPAVAATGTLSEVAGRTNVMANNKVTIGSVQYAFVGKLTNTVPSQIKIAPTFDGSMSNLIAAINHAAGAGTNYSTNTPANPLVSAGLLTSHSFIVTARAAGSTGNSIVTTNSAATTNLTWNNFVKLAGGTDFIAGTTNVSAVTVPYGSFINNGVITNQGSTISANNFLNSGFITTGVGNFTLQSLTTTLTNGSIAAGANLSITTGSLLASNVVLSVGKALNLTSTNNLTDGIMPGLTLPTNGNFWSVGSLASGAGPGVYLNNGFNLPVKPATGDLLGTTVTNIGLSGKLINNLWAGLDRGASPAGYSNNAAVGQLFLDVLGPSPSAQLYFSGPTGSASNALYVDRLTLLDFASYTNHDGSGNIPTLGFNTNLVIYYADAIASGIEVSEKLNGANGNHLRWVPQYAGYFSSTNLVYPDGTTNIVNIALAESTDIDSDQDGIVNANDPTPFFVASEVKFTLTLTNITATNYVKLSWQSIPSATNSVYYSTNLVAPNWQVLTNFVTTGSSSPATATALDKVNPVLPRYYRVLVSPNNFLYYGF